MAKRIGLLAGYGRLPVLAARGITAAGHTPVVIGLEGEVGDELLTVLPQFPLYPVGHLAQIVQRFQAEGVTEVVFAGKVHKAPVFTGEGLDREFLALLASLPRKNDDAILGAVVEYFARAGLAVLPQTAYLQELLVPVGVLSRRSPDARERADMAFGFEMAKHVGALDFGQSVVVKNQAVLAVEAVEGTDEAVKRGGRLGRGGAVLVKVSKPQQDQRFDVPTVGPSTIDSMREAAVAVLAFEAGKTLMIDRQACLAAADAAGLAVVAVDSNGLF